MCRRLYERNREYVLNRVKEDWSCFIYYMLKSCREVKIMYDCSLINLRNNQNLAHFRIIEGCESENRLGVNCELIRTQATVYISKGNCSKISGPYNVIRGSDKTSKKR